MEQTAKSLMKIKVAENNCTHYTTHPSDFESTVLILPFSDVFKLNYKIYQKLVNFYIFYPIVL